MNRINKADLQRIPTGELDKYVPCIVSVSGVDKYLLVRPEDVVVVGDLHPRVKIQFRAREMLVRKGMPAPEVVPWHTGDRSEDSP